MTCPTPCCCFSFICHSCCCCRRRSFCSPFAPRDVEEYLHRVGEVGTTVKLHSDYERWRLFMLKVRAPHQVCV